MSNIASLLKAEITRLSRRELKSATDGIKKASGLHRSDIASLRQRVAAIEKSLRQIERVVTKAMPVSTGSSTPGVIRYSAKRFLAQRQRLEMSAAEVGFLLNVTQQTVYNWESGKTRPSPAQMPAIAALRKLTKRSARAILNREQ